MGTLSHRGPYIHNNNQETVGLLHDEYFQDPELSNQPKYDDNSKLQKNPDSSRVNWIQAITLVIAFIILLLSIVIFIFILLNRPATAHQNHSLEFITSQIKQGGVTLCNQSITKSNLQEPPTSSSDSSDQDDHSCTVLLDSDDVFKSCYALINTSIHKYAEYRNMTNVITIDPKYPTFPPFPPPVAIPCTSVDCKAVPCQKVECIAKDSIPVPCLSVPCQPVPCTETKCSSVPCTTVPCITVDCNAVNCFAPVVNTTYPMITTPEIRYIAGVECTTRSGNTNPSSYISSCIPRYSATVPNVTVSSNQCPTCLPCAPCPTYPATTPVTQCPTVKASTCPPCPTLSPKPTPTPIPCIPSNATCPSVPFTQTVQSQPGAGTGCKNPPVSSLSGATNLVATGFSSQGRGVTVTVICDFQSVACYKYMSLAHTNVFNFAKSNSANIFYGIRPIRTVDYAATSVYAQSNINAESQESLLLALGAHCAQMYATIDVFLASYVRIYSVDVKQNSGFWNIAKVKGLVPGATAYASCVDAYGYSQQVLSDTISSLYVNRMIGKEGQLSLAVMVNGYGICDSDEATNYNTIQDLINACLNGGSSSKYKKTGMCYHPGNF